MATRLQRRASRKNAKRSTGPQTPEGKARSSQNARKHGLFARDTLLPGEDPQEFLQLIADLEQELEAGSGFERRLVRHIADTEWRMRRLVRLETGVLTHQLENERLHAQRVQAALGKPNQQAKPGDENASTPADLYQQSTTELGVVVEGDRDTPVLLTLSLYESRLTRKYFSLLKQLRLTQKLRRTEAVEPDENAEPELLPAKTESRPPATESPRQQPLPTSNGRLNPQPPLSESDQANHLPTPSTARAGPKEAAEQQPEESAPEAA